MKGKEGMRRCILLGGFFFICLLTLVKLHSQTLPPSHRLFDQFGPVSSDQLRVRLSDLAQELRKDTSSLVLIVDHRRPGTEPGYSYRQLVGMRDFLSNDLGVNPDRVKTQMGPPEDPGKTQFWIAKKVSDLPQTRRDRSEETLTDLKIDHLFDGQGCLGESTLVPENSDTGLPYYSVLLIENNDATLVLRAFPQKEESEHTVRAWARSIRSSLASPFGLDPGRITIEVGDSRDCSELEVWLKRRGPVNLTQTPDADRYPSWSPDGKRIAFETNRNGNWDIYVMNSDGSDQKPLTSGKADDRYPSWSPDGTQVMFVRAEDGKSDLFTIDLKELAVKRLAEIEGDELFPDWHPSGEKVAYTSGNLPDTDLFELDLATRKVIRKWSTRFRDLWPRYSRDGDVVFFSRRDSNDEEDDIYVVSSRLGNAARVTRSPGNDFCPAWSPDGSRIAFARVDPESGRSISVLERRSGRISKFGTGFERVTEPDWSPDGKKIAYTAQKDGIWDVWVETVEPREK